MYRIIVRLEEVNDQIARIEKDLRHRDTWVFARDQVNRAGMAIVAAIVEIEELVKRSEEKQP